MVKKEKINGYISSLIINLLSSFVWQCLAILASSLIASGIIGTVIHHILKVGVWVYALCFVIVLIIAIILLRYFIYKHGLSSCEVETSSEASLNQQIRQDEEEIQQDEFSRSDYYFLNYTKEVTVYENGNGILSNKIDITVNRPEKFTVFSRKVLVDDGKKDVKFPPLKKMKKTSPTKRFETYGFWLDKNESRIVEGTVEKYWSDENHERIDEVSKSNPKEIRWQFRIKNDVIQAGQTYQINYAMSIPGLYPLTKSLYDPEVANLAGADGYSSTSIRVDHYIKDFKYIVSFDAGIKLDKEPVCHIGYNGEDQTIDSESIEHGMFYNRYIYIIKEPPYGANISIYWKFHRRQ